MKKLFLLLVSIGYLSSSAQTIRIDTKNTSLIFKVGNNKRLYQSYLGVKLELDNYPDVRTEAYAAAGMNFEFEPAIRMVHADGNPSLELKYLKDVVKTHVDGSLQTDIFLKDEVYQTEVTLHFQSYPDQDLIKTWADIKNNEKKEVVLTNFASAMLHFNAEKYWLTQFHGDWAKEMQMDEQELTSGMKVIDSKLGVRANKYRHPHFFITLGSRPATENQGELLAGTLAYTGNFRLNFEIDQVNTLHAAFGINGYASEYYLKPNESFTTPEFIFTYSHNGKGTASRNLHDWARKFGVMDGQKPRLTLLNNWEATGMKFDQAQLTNLFQETKKLGVDMFLLDDGWFGDKYPRDNDRTSLGDWMVDKKKLPDGISYLVKSAKAKDVKFGIWLEPEMVSPKSELYEKHPEWVLKLPNRSEHLQRNQLVLDLTNPKVQDYIYSIVDKLFAENPSIAYIKWDCNRTMTNEYSGFLKHQSHLYIDYTKGLYDVLKRIRSKYPHIPFMLCSGGGGRVDYGALKYFTEFWPSDNTDGLERVYIQWGYSYFFPANTISAHVTSWGKQSLKFRTDVAMSGKLGYDINVAEFTKDELAFSQQAVRNYKNLSVVIQQGNLYRLVSPYQSNRAVLMYADSSKSNAVLFAYNLNSRYRTYYDLVKLEGLDPQKKYKLTEINLMPNAKSQLSYNDKIYTGEYLMNIGIEVNKKYPEPLTSVVLEIKMIN
ncbi:alpha-galactosidase [Pedobacter sp. ASV28]|uniref:alpha-galactosidase n=1 Tax=Pedobacter sp. ASV28 TaxID=2795123 RepID=UPI0018EADC12|nr:alpha-galactosidase [Pedobacter sp. ASV28]